MTAPRSDKGHSDDVDTRGIISAMKRVTTKLVSVFVLTFLCLNAGAFFCAAQCNTSSVQTPDHCPLKKASPSCHRSQTATSEEDSEAFAGNSFTCCMLPVGVFAAPLEKRSGTITAVAVAATTETVQFAPGRHVASRQLPKFYYRPPPNDARPDRIRNQVFRI